MCHIQQLRLQLTAETAAFFSPAFSLKSTTCSDNFRKFSMGNHRRSCTVRGCKATETLPQCLHSINSHRISWMIVNFLPWPFDRRITTLENRNHLFFSPPFGRLLTMSSVLGPMRKKTAVILGSKELCLLNGM
jgi:hypothetical protein